LLKELQHDIPDLDIPRDILAMLADADERIDRYRNADMGTVPGFVPSDYARVYAALRYIDEHCLAPGDRLCEWGSGFGVATLLAKIIGFDAAGIEIEPDLVEGAEQLAEDYQIEVEFICGSIVPSGSSDVFDIVGDVAWLVDGGADGYQELGLDIDDFDIIYAFPWPGEEEALDRVFDRYAAVGSLLVTYHGMNDIKIQRKMS